MVDLTLRNTALKPETQPYPGLEGIPETQHCPGLEGIPDYSSIPSCPEEGIEHGPEMSWDLFPCIYKSEKALWLSDYCRRKDKVLKIDMHLGLFVPNIIALEIGNI